MPVLNRDQILQAATVSRSVVPVDLPNGDGTVYIRTMTGAERVRCEALLSVKDNPSTLAILPAFCLCDPAGVLLFGEDDIRTLSALSSAFLHLVTQAASRINKLDPASTEAASKNS